METFDPFKKSVQGTCLVDELAIAILDWISSNEMLRNCEDAKMLKGLQG